MSELSNQLPEGQGLDISAFSGMFNNVTNSYKFYFFLAIMEHLKASGFSNEISFIDLEVEMLSLAWYPYHTFHLSFGGQDNLSKKLERLSSIHPNNFIPNKDDIKIVVIEDGMVNRLLRYVPYRLLRPFFKNKLSGTPDHEINNLIRKYADKYFHEYKPLYKISTNNDSIILHDDWLSYIKLNYGIIKDWQLWNLLEYMQKQNPNIPALSSKLLPPQSRNSLNEQRHFWGTIIKDNPTKCIFSGQDINYDTFDLDHYLPWSYVGHNRLWNLIPIIPEVNSSKSNNLPASIYFQKFLDIQHFSIIHSKEIYSEIAWKKHMSCYLSDLFIHDFDVLLDKSMLEKSFSKIIFPSIELASAMGFSKNWKYKSTETQTNDFQYPINDSDPLFLKESRSANTIKYKTQSSIETIAIPFYHDLKIACGSFHDGYSEYVSETIEVKNRNGNLDPRKHFIVCASGDSMDGGMTPVCDGDFLLFEINEGGTISNQLFAVERRDEFGDTSYIFKRIEKDSPGQYRLVSTNPNYDDIPVDNDCMFPFARFLYKVEESNLPNETNYFCEVNNLSIL